MGIPKLICVVRSFANEMEVKKYRLYAKAGDPSGRGKCRLWLAMVGLLYGCLPFRAVCAEAGTWRIDFQGDPGGAGGSATPVSATFNPGGRTWNVLQLAAGNEVVSNGVSDPSLGRLEAGDGTSTAVGIAMTGAVIGLGGADEAFVDHLFRGQGNTSQTVDFRFTGLPDGNYTLDCYVNPGRGDRPRDVGVSIAGQLIVVSPQFTGDALYADAGTFSGKIDGIEVAGDGILEGTLSDVVGNPSLAAMVLKRKVRVLMVSCGGFHNFPERQKVLVSGLSTRLNIEWTIVSTIDVKSGWADPYDVILYDICSTGFPGVVRISGITEPHFRGKAAVAIHCTHHSYAPTSAESAEANWPQFLGAISSKHIHGSPMEIIPPPDRPAHRILSGANMPWNLPEPAPGGRPDELYLIDHLEKTAEIVALGTNEDGIAHPVMWTNRFGRGCVFSTTLAHLTATLADPTFLDVLANGIAWALVETEKPTPSPTPTPTPIPVKGASIP